MNLNDYLLDTAQVDWAVVLQPWRFVVPQDLTIWMVNRFGDIFATLDDGSVHMLDLGTGTFDRLAESRDHFCNLLDQPGNANQWLLIPLVDSLVATGKELPPGYCYNYLTLPVLGGDYRVENVMVVPIAETYGLNASIHHQVKDLPDGSSVKIQFTDTYLQDLDD